MCTGPGVLHTSHFFKMLWGVARVPISGVPNGQPESLPHAEQCVITSFFWNFFSGTMNSQGESRSCTCFMQHLRELQVRVVKAMATSDTAGRQAWCSLDGQILTTFCFSSYKMWTIVFFPPSPKVHHTRVSWHIHWEEKWSQERVCVTFAHELLDSLNHKGSGFRKLLSHSRVLHFLLDPMGLFVFGYSPFQPHHFPAP